MRASAAWRYRQALASPVFWALLGLSALPPELLCRAFGLGMADPAYLAVNLLWWPVDVFGRLAALRLLLLLDAESRSPDFSWRSTQAAVGQALAAEVLVSLRATVVALLGLLPFLIFLSLLAPVQLARPGFRLVLTCLAVLGLVPMALYFLRRVLAPLELLRLPLGAGDALDASRRRLKGRLALFLRLAWPWMALSWGLDLAGLALPDALALALTLPSAAAALFPLALAADF